MAELIGYSDAQWTRSEAGENIEEKFILAVCRTYHVNYDYLVFGTGEKYDTLAALDEQLLVEFAKLSPLNKDALLKYTEFLTIHPFSEPDHSVTEN